MDKKCNNRCRGKPNLCAVVSTEKNMLQWFFGLNMWLKFWVC